MSHINELISIIKGLRAVAEAGIKLQKENTKLIWANSSLKSVVQTCPTNLITARPNLNLIQDLLGRVVTVAQGLSVYQNVGQISPMDPNLKNEIDVLNEEFNKTFEMLKKSDNIEPVPEEKINKHHQNIEKINKEAVSRVHHVPIEKLPTMSLPSSMPSGVLNSSSSTSTKVIDCVRKPSSPLVKPFQKKRIVTTITMSHINELISIIKGLRAVAEAGIKLQKENTKLIWANSSLKSVVQTCPTNLITARPNLNLIQDLLGRVVTVAQGLSVYQNVGQISPMDPNLKNEIDVLNEEFNKTFEMLKKSDNIEPVPEEKINKHHQNIEKINKEAVSRVHHVPIEKLPTMSLPSSMPSGVLNSSSSTSTKVIDCVRKPSSPLVKPFQKKRIVTLNENSKARVVPSSRIGRMFSFGRLAASLGVGTVAEYTRKTFQNITGNPEEDTNFFLSPANAERIVDTLCKVRGAALKLGQLLSIQDEAVISPELQRIFERVRQSADFMPTWQVEKVLSAQLGPDWRSKLQHFEEKPFAAASIGQVHLAVLPNGEEVAMKVQYPGVAKGINSDIDNLFGVMKVWNIFPKGLFVDNIVEVAKKELSWEVDYIREADCTRKFKKLLEPYPEFYVPKVIDELCSSQVITTELVEGVPIDDLFKAPYEVRHDIAYNILRLCLREMFIFRCMQSDPNWANFFYNHKTKQVVLLDFGATREYSKEFMDQYIEIIKATTNRDRSAILRMSKKMKLLTGYESKLMEETHVDTVMIMGEVFTKAGEFDFGAQTATRRIQALVPTILNHRLCPPPEEIYSLHRKLSGIFLLCSKLNVKLDCRTMFDEIYECYKAQNTQ